MGWFKKLTSPLWKPIRGLGRMARGNFKEGIADVGAGVKGAGGLLAMSNPFTGAALMAGGSLMDKADDPGGLKGTKLFKEIAAPSLLTYAGGKLAQGLGGGPQSATGNLTPQTNNGITSLTGQAGPVLKSSIAEPVMQSGSKVTSGIGKAIAGIGTEVKKDPLGFAKLGLDAIGGMAAGSAEDRMLKMQEERFRMEMEELEEEKRRKEEAAKLFGPYVQRTMQNMGYGQ